MLENANLTVTAWLDEKLVGIARSVTDFYYCCYLSDLAVDENVQSTGIGKHLLLLTKNELRETCDLIFLSAPQAEGYYPKIGFESHHRAWIMSDITQLKI